MAVAGDRADESSPGDRARGRDEPHLFQPPQHLAPADPVEPGLGGALRRSTDMVRAAIMVMIGLDAVVAV
jgi:hypothetical protein